MLLITGASVNHLCDLLNEVGKKSQLEDLKMHRTKCSALIKHVITPSMLEKLTHNVLYSLIIDESTDILVCKYMAVCIRYYNVAKEKNCNFFWVYLKLLEPLQLF